MKDRILILIDSFYFEEQSIKELRSSLSGSTSLLSALVLIVMHWDVILWVARAYIILQQIDMTFKTYVCIRDRKISLITISY